MKECKCTFAQKTVGDGCSICNPQLMIEMLQEQIKELEATTQAQEIIIKDKNAYREAMTQPKTCSGCIYHLDGDATTFPCSACVRCVDTDYYEPKAQP